MRILLIAPPTVRIKGNISGVYPLPPLGLAYIAAVLEKDNFSVDILDIPVLKIKMESLPAYFRDNKYSVYGLSCNLFNLRNGIEIAKQIKEINPKAKIIIGGRCNSFSPETIFKHGPDFDIIVKGEGEEVMLNICSMLRDGNENFYTVPGVSFKDNGKIIINPQPPYVNLDKLPLPARHLLPNKYYKIHPPFGIYPPVTIMETSRGCVYNCTFCSLSSPLRERSVNNVIEEIKEITSRFKIKEIHFVDPSFTYNQERIMELCNHLIRNNIRIAWTCKTRVDLVCKDLLEVMSKAGCYMISYGVESGSQAILNYLNKDITVEQTIEAFNLTKNAKIRTIAYVLLGSPKEDDDTVKKTTKLVEKIKPDFVLYGELLPDPNSPLVKQTARDNHINNKDIADFYIGGKNIFREKSITGAAKGDINRWMSYANRSFYIRIDYIFRKLRNLKNLQDLLNLVKGTYFLIYDILNKNTFS